MLAALSAQCPVMARLHAERGLPPLRRRPAGFEGLVHVVVFQQISTLAAQAIWRRTQEVMGAITPERFATASDEDYRASGQSRPKVRTLRAVAAAVLDGTLDLESLPRLSAEDAHAALVLVKGIGPWTADVYLLTCLGHGDAWPAGDIAIQEAIKVGLGLKTRPTPKQMAPLAEPWRPLRGAAAHLWWSYYRVLKKREGVVGK